MTRQQKSAYLATAGRLIKLDPYNAADYDETPESIAAILYNDPIIVINDLLDIIEELQEGRPESCKN